MSFSASILVLLSISMIGRFVRPIEASETVYIRADGSISPATVKIINVDNVTYIFTNNNHGSIVVQRDNIVVDGAGYILQGAREWYSKGIDLTGRVNVTIKNVQIREFFFGIWLKKSSSNKFNGNNITANKVGIRLSDSSSNIISGNNMTANKDYNIYLEYSSGNRISGNIVTADKVWVSYLHYSFFNIYLYHSSGNIISGNNIKNSEYGIQLSSSSNDNRISGNDVANNHYGVLLWRCLNNTIYENNTTRNDYGITIANSSDNIIYHNNFVNNTQQVYSYNSTNVWDYGHPSGGNHWSDYKDRYPDAKEIDESRIWDKQYIIDGNNQDNYPLINPWTPKEEAPAVREEEFPFQSYWWLLAIVSAGILALAGLSYFLRKKRGERRLLMRHSDLLHDFSKSL